METVELNKRLVGVGERIKAKGWVSASINIYVSYLGIFDREPSPYDPMISYRPSITATPKDERGGFTQTTRNEFVRDPFGSDINSLDDAVKKLESSADEMPTMADEIQRIKSAKDKLSPDERRLLGIG